MNFNCKTPCKNCPFRSDKEPFITGERAEEIVESLESGQSFPCHKTINYSGGEDGSVTERSQFCAGALIMLEKMEQPNQMMRIGERLGLYDHRKLDMNAPVYDSGDDMIDSHYEARC